MVKEAEKEKILELVEQLRVIQELFAQKFGVHDILSNSKIFEVLIANSLNHVLIPGHSGSRDAKNEKGEYEYKHYKESSSNHTWTFNDYTDYTISKLRTIEAVIFAHIKDGDGETLPEFDWYYYAPGKVVADYLAKKTMPIKNTRKMINVGPRQVEEYMGIQKTMVDLSICSAGPYNEWIVKIYNIAKQIENISGTKGVLTSNKFWEVLTSLILGHTVLSEQAGHDATDSDGLFYEYKVAKSYSWNFQDISEAVLKKYLNDNKIILAVVNKDEFRVTDIYEALPGNTIKILKKKLTEKKKRFTKNGKKVRRLQVSLSKGDLAKIKAIKIYPKAKG
ncbi:MAG: hypothetical protein WCV69_02220 [Patescibacteria group bacterium]|jgi:hypothetical protein